MRRGRATATGRRPPTGPTRSRYSRSRPRTAFRGSSRSATAGCSPRPFSFYRGAASIMAGRPRGDAATPASTSQLCGDAHLSNFGLFGSPERQLLFDVNDFDETLPGPWEWDVKRLAASFEILGRERGFDTADRRAIVLACVRQYRLGMRQSARMSTLEAWYAHLDVERRARGFVHEVSGQARWQERGEAGRAGVAKARDPRPRRASSRSGPTRSTASCASSPTRR